MQNRRTLFIGIIVFGLLTFFGSVVQAQYSQERTEREWRVKAEKMRTHLLPMMRKFDIDLWIIMSREFNPDPMLDLFGANGVTGWYGHRNAYLFYDAGEKGLETTIIGTHQSGHIKLFYDTIIPYGQEGLSPHIKKYFDARKPKKIAVNQSRTLPMADGLTIEMKKFLVEAVGKEYEKKMVPAEDMLIEYVSNRTAEEHEIERDGSWITWNMLRRAFSNEVITPGKTRLMDLHHWLVDEWRRQGLDFNFAPSFNIQRKGVEGGVDDAENPVILPGDVLHVDFGVKMMGLVTDQQKMAYVLRPGETEPPAGLQKAFEQSAQMCEIVRGELNAGAIGHKVRDAAQEKGKAAGIENSVYSHVQGNWVHCIGAWANPDWPDRYGRHPREPVRKSEFWSIEFNSRTPVPEWGGQKVRMSREEDAYIDENGKAQYFAGPQKKLWLIRSGSESMQ
mgnify:CR=1 FL=1